MSSRNVVYYESEEFWDTDVSCDEEEEYYREETLNSKLNLRKKDFLLDYEDDDTDTSLRKTIKTFRILNLPIELIRFILNHCHLQALSALNRTCRTFHLELSRESSSSVWISARRNAGFPDLLIPMKSDFYYASLLYGLDCMICRKVPARACHLDFNYRLRCCKNCVDSRFVYYESLENTNRFGLNSLQSYLTTMSTPRWEPLYFATEQKYFPPACQSIISRFDRLLTAEKAAITDEDIGKALNAIEAFFQELLLFQGRLSLDRKALQAAQRIREMEEVAELHRVASRKKALEAKLISIGYDKENFRQSCWNEAELFQTLPEINIWNVDEILSTLKKLFVRTRRSRLLYETNVDYEERFERLLSFYHSLEEQYYSLNKNFFIHHSQFMNIPIVHDLIYDRRNYPVLANNTIKAHKSRICYAIGQIRNSNIAQLLRLILEARRAASNLGDFYPDPFPLSSVDALELQKDVPDFRNYAKWNHPYFFGQATCSECGDTFMFNDFPTLDHHCYDHDGYSDSYYPERIVINIRRIHAIWTLCEILQLKEFEIEDVCSGKEGNSVSNLGRSVYLRCTDSSCEQSSQEILLEDALDHALIYHIPEESLTPPTFKISRYCSNTGFDS